MSYSPQTARFSQIAAAVKARIAAAVVTDPDSGAVLDPHFVRVVASDDYKVDIREPFFVFLRYYGVSPRTDSGAGRRAMVVTRRFRVYLYVRSGVDAYGDDTEALTGDTSGLSDREEAVLEALVHFVPADAAGTALTVEPLHPVDSADGPPERPPENEDGLVRSHLDFEVTYLLRVTVADPPAAVEG